MIALSLSVSLLLSQAAARFDGPCSAPPPMTPLAEAAREAARADVFIKATVIQALDPKRHRPEIIRADAVYVGESESRTFVIYRSEHDYDRARNEQVHGRGCRVPIPRYRVGHTFDRLVLEPVPSSAGAMANGQWRFHDYGHDFTDGRAMETFLEEAKRAGRFRAQPPPKHPCCG